ncbi:hypothetical protein KFL_001010040 [Klebsormidium nitens]|uniref:Uncharacterized protein n=1 Tax=Klebsormidium nitens TaxID=105231 RepID=A0A1Y1I011_KLENI|nr:hypothetical protein KFL_001010040 [Klebsormidium nitens]|eukprot:GAQ82117.1 hypothetical protein KFL_001010040 [Klebsormidium nitens]
MGPKSRMKIPDLEIKTDKETYLSIVYKVARKLRLNIIRKPASVEELDYISFLPPGKGLGQLESAIVFSLQRGYEKAKHCSPDEVFSQTQGSLSGFQVQDNIHQAGFGEGSASLDNLYPTVQPKRVFDSYMLSGGRKTPDRGVFYRPWSPESPDPWIGLVFGFETAPGIFQDAWVTNPLCLQAFQRPFDAFKRALQNLKRRTEGQVTTCIEPSLKAVTPHWGEYKRSACHAVRFGQPPSAVYVTFFGDHRDCPRFLLPIVVQGFADALKCHPESVVVVLWTSQQVHVASAEDQTAMYTLGRMQHLHKFQIDAADYKERICAAPFQFSGLSSDGYLVEWKPYPLYGKTEALRVPRGTSSESMRVLYPVPRSEAVARKLERLGDKIPIVTELSVERRVRTFSDVRGAERNGTALGAVRSSTGRLDTRKYAHRDDDP